MLSPSDFNNAVPQFTNGDYASNPINPQYIAEPDAVNYNRGAEPLQTLPAQWWNWFLNKITGRFNKVNIYVKNIFNELTQLLSVVDMSPDGTEGTPTVGQLKCMFQCEYPAYVKNTEGLVTNTTTVNGHALSSNVTVTRSDLGLGTSATVNTGTAAGCIPTVGTALGTTDGQFLATDSTGKLKPSGYSASSFRSSSWTPSLVACACYGKNGSTYSAFGSNAFNSTEFTTCTGTVTQVNVGTTAYNPTSGVISLPDYPSVPTCVACAGKIKRNAYTNAYRFTVALTNGCGTADGTDLYASCKCLLTFCSTTGVLYATCFCGTASEASNADKACCASCNGSGVAFGSSAEKNIGNASGCIPTIGTKLTATANYIVLTDSNGALKPSPYTIGDSAYKTAGSAAGNVPLIGTALGTTNGQFVATDASGCLKPSGYTASCFLGATAKACCAGTADSISKTTSNITCCVYIGDALNDKLPLYAYCGTYPIPLCVSCSCQSTQSCASCCAKYIYPEVDNALCTPNSSSICNKCSFAVLAFNSCTGCVMYLKSKTCLSASCSSCFGTTALRVI